ncbi:hypothetical protein [Nesterenkonia sp. AN1]|nr:hypothetical protein [Nesterenkonia sp. AN1]
MIIPLTSPAADQTDPDQSFEQTPEDDGDTAPLPHPIDTRSHG